jgi:hypothetical protein
MTSMVRLNQVSRDDGVPPALNLAMDCPNRDFARSMRTRRMPVCLEITLHHL